MTNQTVLILGVKCCSQCWMCCWDFLFHTITCLLCVESTLFALKTILIYMFKALLCSTCICFLTHSSLAFFLDDLNPAAFLPQTAGPQLSSCGHFWVLYLLCDFREALSPETTVASLLFIHGMIPSSLCPSSFPLPKLTGNNVVTCQDLKAHTNTAG